jgi:hypothetical protein
VDGGIDMPLEYDLLEDEYDEDHDADAHYHGNNIYGQEHIDRPIPGRKITLRYTLADAE